MGEPGTLELQLIAAADADVERIADVVNAAFSIYPFIDGDRTDAEGVREELGDNGAFVVASNGGLLLGCAMIRPSLDVDWGTDAAVRAADAMYLGLVGVDPAIRKQGLGRRLVAEAERIARELGFASVVLGTIFEMGNVGYYEALGYAVVSRTMYERGHWGFTIDHVFCVMVKAL